MTGLQIFGIVLGTAALCTGAAAVVLHRYKLRNTARIEGLTAYLEAINLGRESTLSRIEDEFSHLEDELYKTVGELRQEREAATAERQRMADNLADIAHQIKTPITSMSLMVQLLCENENTEDADCLQRLAGQLTRLEGLASSLLTLSKLDAGALAIHAEPVDLHSLLTTAAEPVEEQIHQRGQVISITADKEFTVTVDMGWSCEALLNLIKNCSEHTPRGGHIAIDYSQNPLYTEITIEDDGSGFDAADLPHIFKRFYRGKTACKDSVGIGLALSKSIIEEQNGTLRAENRTQGGARFTVRFYRS
ncbi:MAG: HAMP domain-containing sensor histidine kinase [Angelakisella sp.]